MTDYKSIQELIVKAALYDGVSTTISADALFGKVDVIRITFEKNKTYTTYAINVMLDELEDYREEELLYGCKKALFKLLCYPYEEIEVNKEN
jgi:hypothetical protein